MIGRTNKKPTGVENEFKEKMFLTCKAYTIVRMAGDIAEKLVGDTLELYKKEMELLEVNRRLKIIKDKLDKSNVEEKCELLGEFKTLSRRAEKLKIEINELKLFISVGESYLKFIAEFKNCQNIFLN